MLFTQKSTSHLPFKHPLTSSRKVTFDDKKTIHEPHEGCRVLSFALRVPTIFSTILLLNWLALILAVVTTMVAWTTG
jgi:hypothetical protein